MRGASLDIHVQSPSYQGPTVPPFIQHLTLHTPDSARLTKFVDVSAVLACTTPAEIRVAIVNRSENDAFSAHFAFGPNTEVTSSVRVYEVWSGDLKDRNGFGKDEENVKAVEKEEKWDGKQGYLLKNHSFQSELLF